MSTRPGAPDASGRARPEDVPNSSHHEPAHLVIVAVGQDVDDDALSGVVLDRAADGTLSVDPTNGATSHPSVFAGGDVVESPRTVTDAIAWGQRAAWGIDVSLRGAEAAAVLPPPPHADTWTEVARENRKVTRADRNPRARPPELDIDARLDGFTETTGALDESAARAEAARCMICGMCGNCRACLEISGCPAFYVEGGNIRIDPVLCNGCGFCAGFCPNLAIVPVEAT